VYVLQSECNPARHDVGLTADLAKRLEWHNAGQNVHTAGSAVERRFYFTAKGMAVPLGRRHVVRNSRS
jgi:predicted GIY-YIG superfamily endonuclease